MPAGLTAAQRKKLGRSTIACPVHKSLLPEIEKPVDFVYPN